jgi:hypothetical protein
VAKPEHVLGHAAGIGIMLPNDPGSFHVEQSVQNVGVTHDSDLRRIIKAWGDLPANLKAAILAIVGSD